MKVKHSVIYVCLLYMVTYIGSAFIEISNFSKNYKSMASTVELAAEMAVQQASSGAEGTFGSGVLFNTDILNNTYSVLQTDFKLSSSQALDVLCKSIEEVEADYAGKSIKLGVLTYDTGTKNYVQVHNTKSFLEKVVQTKDIDFSYTPVPLDSWVYADTSTKKAYTAIFALSKLMDAEYSSFEDASLADLYRKGIGVSNVNTQYRNIANIFYNKKYATNSEWKNVASISSIIATNIPLYIPGTGNVYNIMRPKIASMGLPALQGVTLLNDSGAGHGGYINTIKKFDTTKHKEVFDATDLKSVLSAYFDNNNSHYNNLKDNFLTYVEDTVTDEDTYGGAFPKSNYIMKFKDNTGKDCTYPLVYQTSVNAVNNGVTYLDRNELQALFVDNMTKLMLGEEPAIGNIGYIANADGDNFEKLLEYDDYSKVPTSLKETLSESLVNNIINNGKFNFIKGKLITGKSASAVNDFSINGSTDLGTEQINLLNTWAYGDYCDYYVTYTDKTPRRNLPVVQYKVVDMCDDSNADLRAMFYQDVDAINSMKPNSTTYSYGPNTFYDRHNYVVVAKVTFFADASISYDNPFVRNSVFIAAHNWKKQTMDATDEYGKEYTVSIFQAEDWNDTEASKRNLHTFQVPEKSTYLQPEDVRYSAITGNALYAYTTYVAIVP